MPTEPAYDNIDIPFHSAGEVINVLAQLPLSDISLPDGSAPLEQRDLRMRHVIVDPGGVIAHHPHANRPTILYIMSGRILQFIDGHDEAIEHIAPSIVMPTTGHWWRNPGPESVEIIGVDLLDPASDASVG